MGIPTLDELLNKYKRLLDDPDMKPRHEAFVAYYSGVATGTKPPLLTKQNAMAAAQSVMVLFEHVKQHGDLYCHHKLTDMVNRSGLDLSPCQLCGETIICIPDGLACCKPCAEKAGA